MGLETVVPEDQTAIFHQNDWSAIKDSLEEYQFLSRACNNLSTNALRNKCWRDAAEDLADCHRRCP
jgi:hypothetical protein